MGGEGDPPQPCTQERPSPEIGLEPPAPRALPPGHRGEVVSLQQQEILSPPQFPSPTSGWGPQMIPPQYQVSTDPVRRRTAGHPFLVLLPVPQCLRQPSASQFPPLAGRFRGASRLYLLLPGCCVSPRAVLSPCERGDARGQVPRGESGLDQAAVAKFSTAASEQAQGHLRAAEQGQGTERVEMSPDVNQPWFHRTAREGHGAES